MKLQKTKKKISFFEFISNLFRRKKTPQINTPQIVEQVPEQPIIDDDLPQVGIQIPPEKIHFSDLSESLKKPSTSIESSDDSISSEVEAAMMQTVVHLALPKSDVTYPDQKPVTRIHLFNDLPLSKIDFSPQAVVSGTPRFSIKFPTPKFVTRIHLFDDLPLSHSDLFPQSITSSLPKLKIELCRPQTAIHIDLPKEKSESSRPNPVTRIHLFDDLPLSNAELSPQPITSSLPRFKLKLPNVKAVTGIQLFNDSPLPKSNPFHRQSVTHISAVSNLPTLKKHSLIKQK